MFGRRKKLPVKGWALDCEEQEARGLRERLGGNTKLWAASLVSLIAAGGILITVSSLARREKPPATLPESPVGFYQDADHRQFAESFVRMAQEHGVKVEAAFVADRMFRLVLPCDVIGDDLEFLSRTAAARIYYRFKVSPIVLTYTEDNNSPSPKQAARTEWSAKAGGFEVRLNPDVQSQ